MRHNLRLQNVPLRSIRQTRQDIFAFSVSREKHELCVQPNCRISCAASMPSVKDSVISRTMRSGLVRFEPLRKPDRGQYLLAVTDNVNPIRCSLELSFLPAQICSGFFQFRRRALAPVHYGLVKYGLSARPGENNSKQNKAIAENEEEVVESAVVRISRG